MYHILYQQGGIYALQNAWVDSGLYPLETCSAGRVLKERAKHPLPALSKRYINLNFHFSILLTQFFRSSAFFNTSAFNISAPIT